MRLAMILARTTCPTVPACATRQKEEGEEGKEGKKGRKKKKGWDGFLLWEPFCSYEYDRAVRGKKGGEKKEKEGEGP